MLTRRMQLRYAPNRLRFLAACLVACASAPQAQGVRVGEYTTIRRDVPLGDGWQDLRDDDLWLGYVHPSEGSVWIHGFARTVLANTPYASLEFHEIGSRCLAPGESTVRFMDWPCGAFFPEFSTHEEAVDIAVVSDEPVAFRSASGSSLAGQALTFEYGRGGERTRSRVLLLRSSRRSMRPQTRGAELFVLIGYSNSAAGFARGLPYFERFQRLVEAE